MKGEGKMKDERKETWLAGARHEPQQKGGCRSPNLIPQDVIPAVRILSFLQVPLCPEVPEPSPTLAAPSWEREFGESFFAVLSCCVYIINNEKQAGVYYIALIYAFGVF